MTEEATRRRNSAYIDVNDYAECVRWSSELGVPVGELKAAVHYVGSHSDDVRRYLKERTLPPLGRNDPDSE